MSRTTRVIMGIDVGATTTAAGLVTAGGDVLFAAERATRAGGPGSAVKTLLGLVEELTAEAEHRRLQLDAVGVGLPGIIDRDAGTMLAVPGNRVPELGGVPVGEEIRRIAGTAVYVENDANALALGEWTFGLGRGAGSLVLLAIGTDVGGGCIRDGELARGTDGWAGEFHSLVVDFDGERCVCGGRGCLGAYVGGIAIADEARRRLASGMSSSLHGRPALSAEDVFRAAAAGDAMARGIVERVHQALGAAVASIVSTLNPEVIVVGGGVARSLASPDEQAHWLAADGALSRVLAKTRIHVVGSTKRQTVRGGAALVLYERSRAGRRDRKDDDHVR